MTYKETYYSIIENRKKNPLPKDEYGEVHHIKPKCLGGSNKDENLVKLTAAEHYRCHYYLVKIYEEDGNMEACRKMLYAFTMMNSRFTAKRIPESEIDELSRLYEELREKWKDALKAIKQTDESNRKRSEKLKGRPKPEGFGEKIAKAKLGKPLSETHKLHMREANLGEKSCWFGKNLSEEHKRKIGKGNSKPKPEGFGSKMAEITKGRRWYNNGEKSVRTYECPDGFVLGRLPRHEK